MNDTVTRYGTHAVAAALATGRRLMRATLSLGDDSLGAARGATARASVAPWVRALARGAPVVRAERATLDGLSRGGLHQGVVCEFEPLPPLRPLPLALAPSLVAPLTPGAPPLLLHLDGVQDPQNLGAVLRSALLLGADGVCLAAGGAPPLGAAAAKASSGALDVWLAAGRLHAVRAAPTWLAAAAAAGWRVLGAAGGGDGPLASGDAAAAVPWRTLCRDAPTILVLGGEGAGLRASVRASCTALVAIPMSRVLVDATCTGAWAAAGLLPLPLLESYNVSVAAALILEKLRPLGEREDAPRAQQKDPPPHTPYVKIPSVY